MAFLYEGNIPVFLKADLKLLFDKAVAEDVEAREATLYLVILVDEFSLKNR